MNFLVTLQLYKNLKTTSGLDYFSVEKYPINFDELKKILTAFPELSAEADDLLLCYKNLKQGFNRLEFLNGKVILTLIIEDINTVTETLEVKADSWFLDGFSPSRNPDMWSERVFSFMKKNSKENATFSTYSSASRIREGLIQCGFTVEKRKGFGSKREMLFGYLPESANKEKDKPWYRLPAIKADRRDVLIIGGGLAGTAAAYHLGRNGFTIHLVERENAIASKASGNPAGFFSMHLSAESTDISRLTDISVREFFPFLRDNPGLQKLWKQTGVLQIIQSEEEEKRVQRAIIEQEINGEIKDYPIGDRVYKGILFEEAGWVSPSGISNYYIQSVPDGNIKISVNTDALELIREGEEWLVIEKSGNRIGKAPFVIIANSFDVNLFEQADFIEYRKVRGQIALYPKGKFPMKLDRILLHDDGYVIPDIGENYIVGSTYNPGDFDPEVNPEHNLLLVNRLKEIIPGLDTADALSLKGRVGFRATGKDNLPSVGMVADKAAFRKNYQKLQDRNPYTTYPDGEYLPGLFVSVNHGSRGILYSYLAGKLLTDLIVGRIGAEGKELLEKINPARYLIRAIQKRL